MKRITSLNDLLIEELADLLNAENQLIEALPKMAQASQLPALKILLGEHQKVTGDQAHRLRDIFSNIGQSPQESVCKVMKGIIAEGEDVINTADECPDRDAAIISVAQRVEQCEIAGYQAACEHAADLGHTMIVELLNKALNEERVMLFYLNELAQYMINAQAIEPKSPGQQTNQQKKYALKPKTGGFYMQDEKFKRRNSKKKLKRTDVSRFISEGNPNMQEPQEKGKDQEEKDLQNPEEQGDLS